MEGKITLSTLMEMKAEDKKITMLTAYDYLTAQALDEVGVDIILVGDSLANVILGYDNTLPVTVEEMIHHIKAVVRGARKSMVIGDMPFLSYQISTNDAVSNAGRIIKEGGAQGVKLEGGGEVAQSISCLVRAGIPVMGHLGLTPQSIHQIGGYRVQGREKQQQQKIIEDACLLQEAGVFSLVLECVPRELARQITSALRIPTIGIGAGPDCDGQVLVTQDLLGLTKKTPKFVKCYAQIGDLMKEAFSGYVGEVRSGKFPQDKHSYH